VTVIAPDGGKSAAQRFADIPVGSTISTGDGGQAVIRFDDGGAVILDHDTELRVVDYRYDAAKPAAGHSALDFLKGSARVVTGKIASTEPANYSLRTPVATLGAQSADFNLASGSLYVSVTKGTVTAVNSAGTMTYGAGQAGFVANAGTLPTAVAASQFPGGVGSAFARLNGAALPGGTLPTVAGGAAGGAGAATGAAAGFSGSTGAAIAVGVGAAVVLGGIHSSTQH